MNTDQPKEPTVNGPTYVYAIGVNEASRKANSALKVGVSSDPNGRLAALQTGSWNKLFLEKKWAFQTRTEAYTAESWIHSQLKRDACFVNSWSGCGEWWITESIENVIEYIDGVLGGHHPEGCSHAFDLGQTRRVPTIALEVAA